MDNYLMKASLMLHQKDKAMENLINQSKFKDRKQAAAHSYYWILLLHYK